MPQNINLTQLRTTISGLGTDNKDFKTITSTKLAVITSTRESDKLATQIVKMYAVYKPKLVDNKHVLIGNFEIVIKQHRHQKSAVAANISNEFKFVEYINQAIKDNGNEPLDISFFANMGKSFKVGHIVQATHSGQVDTRSGNKSDAILITKTGNKIPISLKQDNASRWGSPDAELKSVAEKFFNYVTEQGLTTVVGSPSNPNIFTVNPPIGFKLNDRIASYMIFGNDIRPNGCVIIKTWDASDFDLNFNTNVLTVKCSYIYRSYNDVVEKHIPYFAMRNDASRKVASNIIPPGIRYEVVYEGGGKRGVKIIDYRG